MLATLRNLSEYERAGMIFKYCTASDLSTFRQTCREAASIIPFEWTIDFLKNYANFSEIRVCQILGVHTLQCSMQYLNDYLSTYRFLEYLFLTGEPMEPTENAKVLTLNLYPLSILETLFIVKTPQLQSIEFSSSQNSLKELYIHNAPKLVEILFPNPFNPFNRIQRIHITQTGIREFCVPAEWDHLQYLNLANNPQLTILDINIPISKCLKQIKQIDIDISCSGIQRVILKSLKKLDDMDPMDLMDLMDPIYPIYFMTQCIPSIVFCCEKKVEKFENVEKFKRVVHFHHPNTRITWEEF
jgi:hypothetical protein